MTKKRDLILAGAAITSIVAAGAVGVVTDGFGLIGNHEKVRVEGVAPTTPEDVSVPEEVIMVGVKMHLASGELYSVAMRESKPTNIVIAKSVNYKDYLNDILSVVSEESDIKKNKENINSLNWQPDGVQKSTSFNIPSPLGELNIKNSKAGFSKDDHGQWVDFYVMGDVSEDELFDSVPIDYSGVDDPENSITYLTDMRFDESTSKLVPAFGSETFVAED